MTDQVSREDAEHLKLLSLGHYLVAGVQALIGFFPIIHLSLGAWLLFSPPPTKGNEPFPIALMGAFFVAFSLLWMLVNWTMAVLLVLAGRRLVRRRSRTFCLGVAMSAVVLSMPFGTILGAFTLVVLLRPSVRDAFSENEPLALSEGAAAPCDPCRPTMQ